ncbi:Transposase and inactivated derivatives [Streptococcus constellatus]|nr:Transposase and inactivated derivatives [Streptococcus constellatus]
MNSIPQNIRYLPHTLDTRYHAVKTYRNGTSVAFICRRYKVSKASLMRWNKRFDGSKESLRDKSHRPLTPHPNSHTNEEINWIKQCIRRNPKATLIEIFYKLKTNKGYHRHPCSLFRILRKLGFFKAPKEKSLQTKALPYAERNRSEMANGCQICPKTLLHRLYP